MIIITENHFDAPWARRVTSIGPLPPETALDRAAHEIYRKSDTPHLGVTVEDVLTLPVDIQLDMGFQVEEIYASVEHRARDEPITFVPGMDDDRIILVKNEEFVFEAYLKKNTRPHTTDGYPLELAAYEYRGISPDAGVQLTYGDALDVPASFLARHHTTLTKLTEPLQVRSTCAYLVKPLELQEDEDAAYIRGFLTALGGDEPFEYKELNNEKSLRCISWHWAHEFLRDKHVSLPDFIRQKIANM